MKRQTALILLSFLSIFAITFEVNPATIHANPPQMSIYHDPNGQFTELIPTNWQAETKETYGLLTDPDGKINVYVLSIKGNDLQAAVLDAWKTVAPDKTHDLVGASEVVSSEGIEKTVQFTFASKNPRQQVTATAELYQNHIYVILVEADVIAALNRSSQLNIITSGLSISGLKLVNLAGTKPVEIEKQTTDKLEAFINETLPELGIPSVEVAIVQNGKIIYAKGFGVREQGGNVPVTPQTMMMIGSVTKSMTTMMMATVVDDGKMSWDTLVVKVMPQFVLSDPERTRTLTMRELVCACLGMERHDAVFFFRGATFTPAQLVQSLPTIPIVANLGETFHYSNQLVAVGGYASAIAAGGSYDNMYNDYASAMQHRVWGPIGMTSTTVSFDTVMGNTNRASPHALLPSGDYQTFPVDFERSVSAAVSSGGVWSNAEDLGRYVITELQQGVSPDDNRIVSAQNLEATWQPQIPITATSSYGLGWNVDQYKGVRMIWHEGNTAGFNSLVSFLPDSNLGVVILTNVNRSQDLHWDITRKIYAAAFGQPDDTGPMVKAALNNRHAKRQLSFADTINEAEVTPFLGNFTNPELGDITLRLDNGKLRLDAMAFKSELRGLLGPDGRIVVYLTSDAPLAGLPFIFTKDETGKPVVILNSPERPGATYTFSRVS